MQRIFFPAKKFLADALARFELPQWWPFDGLGTPFLSVPIFSVFHPSTVLFALLPFETAFLAQILLAPAAALVGTYRLSRALGTPAPFAAVSAAAYVFSGYFIGVLEYTSTSLAAATLPFLLWAVVRCRRGTGVRPLACAIATGLLLLAGDPQIAVMAGLLCLALAAGKGRRGRVAIASISAGLCLGGLLAAVQLLPALHLFSESARAVGRGLVEKERWSLGLSQALAIVVPSPSGQVVEGFIESTYVGLSTMVLAAAGVAFGGRLRVRLGLIAAASLVLAAGHRTPLWSLFATVVPFWNSFQFPIKAIAPFVLSVALLAGHGLWGLARRVGRRASIRQSVLGLAGGGAIAAPFLGPAAPFPVAVMLALAASTFPRSRAGHAWFFLAAAALALLEPVVVNAPLVHTVPRSFYDPPALVAPLLSHGAGVTGQYVESPWKAKWSYASDLSMNEELGAALVPDRLALYGLASSTNYVPGYSARYTDLVFEHTGAWLERLAGVYGVGFVILRTDRGKGASRARTIATDPVLGLDAVALSRSLPRAYVTYGSRVVNRAKAIETILGSDFRPGREVILEEESLPPGSASIGSDDLAEPALRVERGPSHVEVDVELRRPGFLVLNESFFKGIAASEQGRPLPVLPGNHLVRAVCLDAGPHRVRFEFQTPGLWAGLFVSLATASVLLVLRSRP